MINDPNFIAQVTHTTFETQAQSCHSRQAALKLMNEIYLIVFGEIGWRKKQKKQSNNYSIKSNCTW